MIRAIIFDLGHTIWDILPDDGGLARAYATARATLAERLGRADLPSAEALQRAVADVLRESAPMYFMEAPSLEQPPSDAWVDQGFRRLGLELDAELVRAITPPLFATEIDRLHCADGTIEAVRNLHDAGYTLGCVTNTLADTATIRAMLRRDGIEDVMRSVVVSADEGWRKPHRSLFEKALRETCAAAHEAVFIGDSPWHDVGGAQAVGMRTVLTRQYVTRPTEGMPEPDAVISHLRELREFVERW